MIKPEQFAQHIRELGLRVQLEFPAEIREQQTVWHEDSPMSEQELRALLEEVHVEVLAIEKRVEELRNRAEEMLKEFPDAPRAQLEGEVPDGIYLALVGGLCALAHLSLFNDTGASMGRSLSATPESLREEWLRRHLRERADGDLLGELVEVACSDEG